MIRVVLDTNIIISGLGWQGAPQKILLQLLDKKFTLVTSPDILKEIYDVLFRKKFDFIDKNKKDEFLLLLSELSEITIPKNKIYVCRDKEDNKFIETALSAKVNIIVSGDLDLLSLKEYNGVKIISSNEFLSILDIGL